MARGFTCYSIVVHASARANSQVMMGGGNDGVSSEEEEEEEADHRVDPAEERSVVGGHTYGTHVYSSSKLKERNKIRHAHESFRPLLSCGHGGVGALISSRSDRKSFW